jgi:nucleoside-diphosphate-sugar epimerase
MRIVITGATGNVGTSVIEALAGSDRVQEIVGLARRAPVWGNAKTRWVRADVATDDLAPHFAGADVVIHLAWLIQPARDERVLEAVNVTGSRRVFEAAAASGAGALVYASSIGAYSPGPKDRGVGEDWPTNGIASCSYARHKAAVEKLLDAVERAEPGLRVVRLRPGLIFKREAAQEIRRYFAGPLLPSPLVRPGLIPVVPSHPRLRVQAVHSRDVGEAYKLAALNPDARGAYNVAADPPLDGPQLGRILGARPVSLSETVLRGLVATTFAARLQPTAPGWVDMAFAVPLMDTRRARTELGWDPRHSASEALQELLDGLRERAGVQTPPLDPAAGGPLRIGELRSGVGARGGW